MDIRKLAVSATGTLHLRNANDELIYADDDNKKPVEVVLYSPGSKEFARATANRQKRFSDFMAKKGGKANLSPEIISETRIQFLTDCTKSFSNLSYDKLEGDALATAVYSDKTIGFIADQVEKHLNDWANFTPGQPTI